MTTSTSISTFPFHLILDQQHPNHRQEGGFRFALVCDNARSHCPRAQTRTSGSNSSASVPSSSTHKKRNCRKIGALPESPSAAPKVPIRKPARVVSNSTSNSNTSTSKICSSSHSTTSTESRNKTHTVPNTHTTINTTTDTTATTTTATEPLNASFCRWDANGSASKLHFPQKPTYRSWSLYETAGSAATRPTRSRTLPPSLTPHALLSRLNASSTTSIKADSSMRPPHRPQRKTALEIIDIALQDAEAF